MEMQDIKSVEIYHNDSNIYEFKFNSKNADYTILFSCDFTTTDGKALPCFVDAYGNAIEHLGAPYVSGYTLNAKSYLIADMFCIYFANVNSGNSDAEKLANAQQIDGATIQGAMLDIAEQINQRMLNGCNNLLFNCFYSTFAQILYSDGIQWPDIATICKNALMSELKGSD